MLEGAVAELVGACAAGGVLTAWALDLALSPFRIGLLGALPFIAQLVQLPASWVTRRFGSRRTALFAVGLSRQCVLPLACLPFIPLSLQSKQALFLGCVLSSSLLGIAGNNAWTSWMGDLVPAAVRGRYFGRRAAICALAATCSSLAAGLLLDVGRSRGRAGAALCALSLLASLAGAVTTLLLRRQAEPRNAAPPEAPTLREALAPVRDSRARRLLAFQIAWSAATGTAAAFYPLHMIGNLRMGFVRMALYAAATAAFKMLAAPLWGRWLDRRGGREVLVCCSFALSASPLLWIAASPDRLWPLAIEAALNGAATAGLSLAAFSLPLTLSKPRERAFYVGLLAAAGGAATGLASAAGGALVHFLPAAWSFFGLSLLASHALFLVAAAARLVASFFALRIVEPPLARVVPMPLRTAPARAKLSA